MLAGVEECGRESGFQLPPTGRVTLPDLGLLETRIGDYSLIVRYVLAVDGLFTATPIRLRTRVPTV